MENAKPQKLPPSQESEGISRGETPKLVTFLKSLVRDGKRGELASLRRSAICLPDPEHAGAMAAGIDLYRLVGPHVPPGATRRERQAHYAVAVLFSHYPDAPWTDRTFGFTCWSASSQVADKSADRRFAILCHCPPQYVHRELLKWIELAKSARSPVNWTLLLNDIAAWSETRTHVQMRWASGFYGGENDA